ncbi:MAG: RodZ domain-containing protein [Acetobacteraceae bacterium]
MSSGGASNGKASRTEPPAYFPVGKRLKEQRVKLGWDLSDVAAWLRIRETYLIAFEEGRTEDLPSGVYVVGFLRSYARALGLDADDIVSEFQAVIPLSKVRSPALNIPEPLVGRGVPVAIWAAIGLVLIVIAYTGIYHYAGDDSADVRDKLAAGPTKTVPKNAGLSPEIAAVMPEPPAPAPAAETSSLPPASMQAAEATPANTGSDAAPIGQATQPEIDNAQPSAAQIPAPVSNMPATGGQAIQTGQEVATPSSPIPTVPESPTGFDLVASHNTWVRVTDKDGQDVCNRVLKPGEICSGKRDKAPYRITTGNAGGVAFRFGDAVTAPLGENGQVVRNLTLTSEDITQGRAPDNTASVPPEAHPSDSVLRQSDSPPVTAPNLPGDGGAPATIPEATKPNQPPPASAMASKQKKRPEKSESDRLNDRQLGQIRTQVSP